MYSKYLQLTTGKILTCAKKNLLYITIPETFFSQYKIPVKKWQCLKLQKSNFHTTQRLHYPSSLTLCFGSIICGYYVRNWWLSRTPAQQEKFIGWYRQRKHTLYGSLGVISFMLFIYFLTCIERDPVLHKSRFILFDQAQRIQNAKILYHLIVQTPENVVPLTDPMYTHVARAIRRLKSSNQEIFENIDWTITIIYRIFNIASFPNVLILPDRNIIVLYDIFNFIKSNDQLTFILAHEMSHEMLLHTSETLSWGILCDIATMLFSFFTWVFYDRNIAALICSGMYIFSSIVFSWYKRRSEIEADEVGLKFAAKSCIDPREVLVFWEIMKTFEELSGHGSLEIPLFMQHPTLEQRRKRTLEQMPQIMELRNQADCSALPTSDPRDNLPFYKKDVEKHMQKGLRILGMRL